MSIIDGGGAAAGRGRRDLLTIGEVAEAALTTRNYDAALNLLECAAKALDILYARRNHLEASLEDVSTQAEGALVAAQAKVLEWQKLAAGLKNEVQDLTRQLAAMQQRAELAEMQTEVLREQAEAADRQTADALGLSHGLQAKIMAAFGRESTAHKALSVVVDDVATRGAGAPQRS